MSFYELIGRLDDIEKKIDGNERWLSTSQAIEYCSLSEKTLRRAVVKGTLKCSNTTGKNLYLKSDLNRWLKAK
jgi:hypothetical protein|tara:strand:+ start:112 stop:330 length:219 start_codon:yes stop_codon:yes gene_type:complete